MNLAMAELAATYSRYSTDRQNPRSITDQEALWEERAPRDGFTIIARFSDDEASSASLHGRPGVAAMLRAAKAGKFTMLLIECLDRLSRSRVDLPWLYERLTFAGVTIIAYDDGKIDDIRIGVRSITGPIQLADIRNKVRRGLRAVVRDGRHAGGCSFGYRPVKGEPGKLAIDEQKKPIVIRILTDYANGKPPRDIAVALNREKIPGPHGGVWHASTIAGSRKRQNGILQNALYVGRIVWNRQSFVKDPETGRRVSRLNPESEWMTAPAPELRIVGDDLWKRVQNRRARRAGNAQYRKRPRHLLSGLLKCGHCGSGYIVSGSDKRGLFLRCSHMLETGLCDNRRTIGLDAIEKLVVDGLENKLTAPDLVAEYVREFHRTLRELGDSSEQQRTELIRRLATIETDIKKTVKLLVGKPSRALRSHLAALEDAQAAAEAELQQIAAPPMQLHPKAAEVYRRKLRDLRRTLAEADPDNRDDAIDRIRELIEKIVIKPTGPYKGVDIEIHGQMAGLLQNPHEKPARSGSVGAMVAGVGFEPTTFRL